MRLAPLQGKPGPFNLLDNRVYAEWCEALTACNAQVLIIDTVGAAFASAGLNEVQSTDVKRWLQRVEGLRRNSTLGEVILIGHTTKDGRDPRGAVEMQGGVDGLWNMSRTRSGKRKLTATIRAGVGATVYLPEIPGGAAASDAITAAVMPTEAPISARGLSASADRVLSTLRANEGDDMSYRALRTAVAYNLPTLNKACEQLTQRGLVEAFDGSRGKRVRLL